MNLLQMLTQKKTDPLTQFVDRERMIRRNPTKFVGDFLTRAGGGDPDAGMLDMVDPARERQSDVLGLPPLTPAQEKEIQGGFMETPDKKKADKEKRQGMIKGAIGDIGSMFASALQQQPQSPLNFAPLQMGGQSFLIDPAFLQRRALGGPVKKRTPYLVGENGPELIVPEEDGMVIPNRGMIAAPPPPPDEVTTTTPEMGTRILRRDAEPLPDAPTEETVTETVTEPSIADKLRVQIEEYQDPDRYKKGSPRYDKKRNWKDALRSAGYGILQALASAPANSDTASMLGRAIGGAATGGVMGATMDNVDEKMRDQFKLAQLVPQYKDAMGMQKAQQESQYNQARIINELAKPTDRDLDRLQKEKNTQAVTNRLKMNVDFRRGIAKPYIDENGKLWKQFLNDPSRPMEPVENPITHEQEFVPGEQGIMWPDPNTGQMMSIKAKQSVMPSATIAAGNANRVTAADKDNAMQYWKTESTNIENQMKWLSDIKALTTAAITAESGMVEDPGTRAEMQGKLDEIIRLSNSDLPETADPEKAQEQRVKRVNELVDDYNKLNNTLIDNLSKSAVGKAKADQIRAQIASLPRPAKLTWKPYKATMVQGGVSGSVVSEGVFIERLKANGITDPAEQKALINKARADGKIK